LTKICKQKAIVGVGEDAEEPRPRSVSTNRPRSHTLSKRKCVDASSQTTFRIIVVDESGHPESGDKIQRGQEVLANPDPAKQSGISEAIESLSR
jgi:hypothetical protein